MFKKLLLLGLMAIAQSAFAQMTIDQHGLRTTVLETIATDASPQQFLLAEIGYNSHHWQMGGTIIIELFRPYYGPAYQKYLLEVGSSRGTTGTVPQLFLTEAYGDQQSSKIELGTAVNLGSQFGGYTNLSIPVYLHLKYYARCKVRITYMQDKVTQVGDLNQIKIYDTQTGMAASDFSPPQVNTHLASTGNLELSHPNGSHYLMGNVGIGTTTPQEKLSVNGKIRAKEIKVEAENWPDYVFEETYEPKPLLEIEKFIKANKHLPDVPSAKEVAQNGIELGEMNKILLKKIEELTLHLINKDKQVQEQGLAIQKLSAQMQALITHLKSNRNEN